jgi:RimJ/RimL family protein N-acetyltransferase
MSSDRTVVFTTERLIIRIAREDDAGLFHALWTSPQVMVNVGFPQGLRITRDELEDRLSKQGESVFGQLLVVELRTTGQAIGECHMRGPDEEGIAEPDVKLLPAFWGHQYGAEAWRELVTYLFTHTDCEAVQGTPNVENVASIKMQESAGAVRVGQGVHHFPASLSDYTTPVHYYVYQVRRADWQSRHAAEQDDEARPV